MYWKNKLSELFGIDLRSLAAFRIGVALLLIADLINRAGDLKAHYTDWGILPRGFYLEEIAKQWYFSVHFMNGTAAFQVVLFVIAGLLAVALLVGYRTRLVTILSWLLLISLQSRNPMVLQAGDVVLRLYLFWAMFLPLGAVFSIDSAMNSDTDEKPYRIFNVATFALIIQIILIYVITAILKDHPRWWTEGSAIYYALSIDQFTTPFGHWLLQFPALLKILTFISIRLELYGPFLLFVPFFNGPIRTMMAFLFIGLHVGFIFCLELGLFPYVSIVGWLIFLPSWFWKKLFHRFRTVARMGLRIYYDGDCGFCKKMVLLIRTFALLPATPLIPAQQDLNIETAMRDQNSWVVLDHEGQRHFKFEAVILVCRQSPLWWPMAPLLRWRPCAALGDKIYTWVARERSLGARLLSLMKYRPLPMQLTRWGTVVVLVCFVYVLMWNIRTTNFSRFMPYFPRSVNGFAYTLRIDQYWNMFAPYPLTDDGWYVMPGELFDGRRVDVFRDGKPVDWDKPDLVSRDYTTQRWRKYLMNIWEKKHSKHRLPYAQYVCRAWNKTHQGGDRLQSFEIYFMREDTPPPGHEAQARKVKLFTHRCFGRSKRRDRTRSNSYRSRPTPFPPAP